MTVKQALSMSGLLFQPSPEIGSWQCTRPGALQGEIVAFTNKPANFDRLSIRYYNAGTSDDNGRKYDNETWIVEKMDIERDYHWQEEFFGERENAIERVEEIMSDVTERRE
jgi:hypothetical protein